MSTKIRISDEATKDVIPAPILEFFRNKGVDQCELIEENVRKGRYCFAYQDGEKKRFLKWSNDAKEYEYFHQALQKEHTVYRILQGRGITPEYVEEAEHPDLVITEFLPKSTTLREKIKELLEYHMEEDIRILVETLIREWIEYVERVSPHRKELAGEETGEDLFRKYLSSLLKSGPFGTTEKRTESMKNRVLYKVYLRTRTGKVRKLIRSLNYTELPLVHGDFHANNVLVAGDHPVIIDLESVRSGIPEIEIAYMYAQICLLIRDRKDLMHQLNEYLVKKISANYSKSAFRYFFRLFYRAIRKNHRFY